MLDVRRWLCVMLICVAACEATTATPTTPPATTAPSTPTPAVTPATAQPTEPLPVTASAPTAEPPTVTAPTLAATPFQLPAAGFALKFNGTGRGDIDRVKIKLDPQVPANVGGDFTLEFWMKTEAGANVSPGATCNGNDGWITGNILFDRDVFNAGDNGDYGLSLTGGRMAFGVNVRGQGNTLCGQTDVADDVWHHIAVTRNAATGQLRLFVDGKLDAEATGPTGDVSYRVGRGTQYANDPYLVIGAEKHDYDNTQYPSYRGWIDEVRLSSVIRYSTDFARPTMPFAPDADTAALYHFDEGTGVTVSDSAPGGGSPGVVRRGEEQQVPQWLPSDAPLTQAP